ncbi:MAG: isoprenyl transferase [Phycisphaerae bacterium]|nr:isoprenyl transferase [Phycisphaerae bacterium]
MASIKNSPEQIKLAREELGFSAGRFPASIAIIMDGNGRWARQRDLPRFMGHREGAKIVRRIVTESARLGLEALMLYSFSQQNWSRPAEEVDALMQLYTEYLIHERQTVMDNNVRLRHLGSREGLPEQVLRELDESVRVSSKNTGMFLCLALNYGSREEMTTAAQKLATRAVAGEISPDDITPEMFADSLDTHGVPDPDLLVRTAGEMRISNYLLWQISYSEFYVTDTFFPDFDEPELHKAIRAYTNRDRRFGGVDDSNS